MLTGTKLNNLEIKEKKKNHKQEQRGFSKEYTYLLSIQISPMLFEALNQRGFK